MTSPRIGIFGGSFDPPHKGHKSAVKTAITHLSLDRVYIVPSYQTPGKPPPQASAEKRIKMLQLLFKSLPKTHILDIEIKRGGESLTIDTLDSLSLEGRLFLIIGEDILFQIHAWQSIERIMKKTHLAVIMKSEGSWMKNKTSYPKFLKKHLKTIQNPSELKGFQHKVYFIYKSLFQQISSSDIKEKIKKNVSIEHDLPKDLLKYKTLYLKNKGSIK